MGLSIAKLGKKNQPMTIDLGEEGTLQVVYAPSKYTPGLEQSMNRAMKDNLPGLMLATMVSKVIVAWDLTEDLESAQARVDAKNQAAEAAFLEKNTTLTGFVPPAKLPAPLPKPPTAEGAIELPDEYPVPVEIDAMQELPLNFLSKIVEEVAKQNRPEAEKSGNSDGSY